MCPPLDSDPKHNVQVRVMIGLLLRADGVCVSSLANVPILSSHGTLQFLGYLIVWPMMRRLWFGNIAGFINSTVGTQLKRRANCEWVFVEGPPPAPYSQTYHEDHCLVIATRTIRSGDELFTHYEWN